MGYKTVSSWTFSTKGVVEGEVGGRDWGRGVEVEEGPYGGETNSYRRPMKVTVKETLRKGLVDRTSFQIQTGLEDTLNHDRYNRQRATNFINRRSLEREFFGRRL